MSKSPERIKIKSEAAVIETIVKVEVDSSLDKETKGEFLATVKDDKIVELNESNKDFFAEKEAEKEAMKLKAQKMRRRSQIDKEFYFDKKDELKGQEAYWEKVKVDSEKLTVELIDSMIKSAASFQPRYLSIISADKITEEGFTLSKSAYLGAVPWVASKIAWPV